jgi:signal transduction histidine kinase
MKHRHLRRAGKRRRSLFGLMLIAFVTVIMLSICGVGMVFVTSARLSGQDSSGPPWVKNELTVTPVPNSTPVAVGESNANDFRSSSNWRGPAGALLAFAVVLLGAAAFFSSRVTRPLTRLTRAAQTMARGDLTTRVEGSAVREIDELAGAFNTMASSLSDADRQRRQMTADVAHELRTPISIIRGRLEGIQDGVYSLTPEQVTTLLGETALLERLIEDLRILALAEAGQLPLYRESIDPASLLRDVALSFQKQGHDQGVEVRVADLPDVPEIEVDPQRISQVLSNLVANALRYTPAGGMVLLNAWRGADGQHDTVCISVSDNGSGIAPADLPHIFDRFYRADPARTRASGGAGLGLAIAKRIIEAHRGVIWVDSTQGKGTTVSFSLPRQPTTM